ncbi:MAG: transcriptional regulator [Acidobacteriota bacterium]
MAWISKILFFLIFLILLSLIRSFLARLLNPSSQKSKSGPRRAEARRTISGQMVKDPQCGMHVAMELAVTARVKGETVHFCSEECRNSFINELKTHPASKRTM